MTKDKLTDILVRAGCWSDKVATAREEILGWIETELVPKEETRFLRKDNLQWQLGWVEGHKRAIAEMREKISENKH